ncbi:hypothetical protein AVEN_229317-1 [Araneus ventricosus]|uniref:DUF4817 domain-containing protein n=1 Tax=Araneus ventricosus TaxID=182803 RepID=A0A4Y2T7M5_ARAVE|nr:hypothetical protein AVEN_229317-1 [Araneus ventricosus]
MWAKSASRLYRERFPEGRHPARQTILKVVKRLRETGCVTSRPRVRKPSNVGRKVQPEDVLAYALAHPQSKSPEPSLAINMGSTRLIGPVFYEGTLTGQRYLELLQNVITDFVESLPFHQLRNVLFQHDGAPPHKISNAKQYLMETFQNQFIGYGGLVEWPPRSPVLTLLDFFLWGHIKGQICPRSIDPALKLSLVDTHKETVSSQFKFPESNKNPPDFSDFTTVTNRKKLKKDSQVYMANKTDNVSQIYKTPQLPDKEKVSSLKLGKNSSRHVSNSVIKTSHTTVNDSTTSRVHSVDTEPSPYGCSPSVGENDFTVSGI